MSLDRQAVERRLQDKNLADTKEAKLLIFLGFPFGLASFLALTTALSSLLWLLRLGVGCGTSLFIAAGVSLVAMALDLVLHPSEHWHRTRIYLAASGGDETDSKGPVAGKAPAGEAEEEEKETPDFLENVRYGAGKVAHVFLGGPRNIRKGLELLDLIRARSHEDAVGAAALFLQWLRQKGRTPEADLELALGANPRLGLGYGLASDLGLVEWKTVEGRKVAEVRHIQGLT